MSNKCRDNLLCELQQGHDGEHNPWKEVGPEHLKAVLLGKDPDSKCDCCGVKNGSEHLDWCGDYDVKKELDNILESPSTKEGLV